MVQVIVHRSLTQNWKRLKFWIEIFYMDIYSLIPQKDDASIRECPFKKKKQFGNAKMPHKYE